VFFEKYVNTTHLGLIFKSSQETIFGATTAATNASITWLGTFHA